MKATFHHEITVKFTLWMRSGHALLFLDSMARDPSCSSVFKISLWCYVAFNIQGWLQRLESFHKTREPHKHSGQNSPGLDSSLLEKRKLPKHFDHAQADLKKTTLTLNSKANPANIFPSAHLANADFKSISATGLGQTEALFRSLQHVIHEKGRNKRLRFISLLFSNPSYYRTGTMFDGFIRRTFSPCPRNCASDRSQSCMGGYKSCKHFSVPCTSSVLQKYIQGDEPARRRWLST